MQRYKIFLAIPNLLPIIYQFFRNKCAFLFPYYNNKVKAHVRDDVKDDVRDHVRDHVRVPKLINAQNPYK